MPSLLAPAKEAHLWCSPSFSSTLAIQAFQEDGGTTPTVHFVRDFETGELLFVHGPIEEVLGRSRSAFAAEAQTEDVRPGTTVQEELRQRGTARLVRLVPGPSGITRRIEVSLRLVQPAGRRLVAGWAGEIPSGESPSELNSLLEAIDSCVLGFLLVDAGGRITHASGGCAQMFAYPGAASLTGRPWASLHPADLAGRLDGLRAEAARARGARELLTGLRADGSRMNVEARVTPRPGTETMVVYCDRTDHLLLNERVRAGDAIFKQFLEVIPAMVAISGPDGAFEFVNRRFADFWDVTVSSMKGRTPASLPRRHSELRDALAAPLPATMRVDHPLEQELRLDRTGEPRVVRLIRVALDATDATQRRVYNIVSDITSERLAGEKMAETAERRRHYVEMQQEFISMVSHEFRTPIAVIQGAHYLFGQRKASLSLEQREWFDKILDLQTSGLSRLKELVDQVLMLNRLERMTHEPQLTLETVADLIQKVVDIFNTSLGEKRVLTDCQVPAGWQCSLDVRMITAALENLISNGLKYSTDKVSVTLRQDDGGWTISVADRGHGIPAEEQKNLFQPFFRASNVGRTPGTGLGLSIVQRAVEFHGGKASCESKQDQGTLFLLRFPPPVTRSPTP